MVSTGGVLARQEEDRPILVVEDEAIVGELVARYLRREGFHVALAFHYATGLALAALYVVALEPHLPGPPTVKGLLFGLLPWLVNGLLVLPLLCQGPLGLSALPRTGVAYPSVANAVFGVLLGVLYARSRDRRPVAWGA